MKRFYLYNSCLIAALLTLFLFFQYSGFFIAVIMKQDIIFFIAVLPTYLLIGLFGIGYQFFAIDWKNKRNLTFQIPSMILTFSIMMLLVTSSRVYITFSTPLLYGTIIILILINIYVVTMMYFTTVKKRASSENKQSAS